MRWIDIAILSENATSGATSSGNVATNINTKAKKPALGVGFSADGDYGIYNNKKRKKSSENNILNTLIKRNPS